MMMDDILVTSGVLTLSEKSLMASEAGTPHSIWAAIFLISGGRRPYLPDDATTMASARACTSRW